MAGVVMSGAVDPETLYTKQACIGKRSRLRIGKRLTITRWWELWQSVQGVLLDNRTTKDIY